MKVLHICNTFFERELELNVLKSLGSWFRTHPIVLQLQFLPLLYASNEDFIGLSDLPLDFIDDRAILLDSPPLCDRIESWGPSLAIADWAKKHQLPYSIPDWNLVREINSKAFSFSHGPKLPGAALLHNSLEVEQWIRSTSGPRVLKTCYGTAGQGHFLVGQDPLPSQYPLIGEPWVERTFDFSTQWNGGQLVGATPFENEPGGTYKATLAGPNVFGQYEWALEQHLGVVRPLVEEIAKRGYSGNLGIDAFVYRFQSRELLHPIVEINARKTMSWVALQIQKTRPEKPLRFTFSQSKEAGPLPQIIRGKRLKRQILLSWPD